MRTLRIFLKRILRARGVVLLLLLVPVTVASLVLNDRREFLLPVENPAKAFAATVRTADGAPVVGGLVIRPNIPGEVRRFAPPVPVNVPGLREPAAQPLGQLALVEPESAPPLQYSPEPAAATRQNGRALPPVPQDVGSGGSGFGLLGSSPTTPPTDPPAGIPEPESWALMAFGMGVIGVALRRRRAAAR